MLYRISTHLNTGLPYVMERLLEMYSLFSNTCIGNVSSTPINQGAGGPYCEFIVKECKHLHQLHITMCCTERFSLLTCFMSRMFSQVSRYLTAIGRVVLESVQYRGQHVGVLPNGTVKEPGRTGTGQHAQFVLITLSTANTVSYISLYCMIVGWKLTLCECTFQVSSSPLSLVLSFHLWNMKEKV